MTATDWTAGYVADIGYTYGYYLELSTLRAELALAFNAVACPEFNTACELGFGQGISANFHAAASPVEWYGTDFNPAQAGFAQELGAASGANINLYDDSFAEFANRSDLPEFDFIGLHGIWSWISDENRQVIVDFIDRKLKVGGVLYISYNTFPGWAAFAPMRNLMTQHAEVIGSEGRGIVSKIDGAIEFAENLLKTNPLFLRANPQIGEKIKNIKDQNRHYLAHEYFNKDWHPMHFSKIAEMLKLAKMDFVCSAHLVDSIHKAHFTNEQHEFLKSIPDTILRESVRDFMVNQQFRRDYWVKGRRNLSMLERHETLHSKRFLLQQAREDIKATVALAQGEANLTEEVYKPILDLMADQKPLSIGEISESVASNNISFEQVTEAMMVLATDGRAMPVQGEAAIEASLANTQKLNEAITEKSRSNANIMQLASPVSACGVSVNRLEQLFLKSRKLGKQDPKEWAQDVWSILAAQGERLVKDGKPLETPEENLAAITDQAVHFAEKRLAVLESFKVA